MDTVSFGEKAYCAAKLLKMSNTLEIEGSDKPALITELLALITPRKSA